MCANFATSINAASVMMFQASIALLILSSICSICLANSHYDSRNSYWQSTKFANQSICVASDDGMLEDFKYNLMLDSPYGASPSPYTGVFLPIYTSHPLDSYSEATSAVIYQHGLLANADYYFCSIMDATFMSGVKRNNDVIVIAPLFASESYPGDKWQILGNSTDIGIGFQGSSCWFQGCDNAGSPSNFASSFDALDQIVMKLLDASLYPKLKLITFAGFSAGAQMYQVTNRTSRANSVLVRKTGVIQIIILTVDFHCCFMLPAYSLLFTVLCTYHVPCIPDLLVGDTARKSEF